jgi:glucose-6-phosphate isomerase
MERRLAHAVDAATASSGPRPRRIALLMHPDRSPDDLAIPKAYQDLESVGYLGGQGLGELAAHERDADEITRWTAGELTIALTLPDLGANVLGQIVALTDAAVLLARDSAAATGERDGQRLVYGLAGRPGYESERATAQRLAGRREDRYVG